MINLVRKEFKLSAHILSYLFIAFGFMTFIPGYPILVGVFFSCLGIFQSFQSYRESNDISYSILLPVTKKDIVKAKFIFVSSIELMTLTLMAIITLIRMTLLKDASVYVNNPLLTANLVFLGYALIIFGCFNILFVRGFFKTGYNFGKPFVSFGIIGFLVVGLAEALRYFPGLEVLNSFGFDNIGIQLIGLFIGIILYALFTFVGYKKSVKSFEKIDL
ncbi:ABC-2 transporter permease [Acholeplasma equifetale]|uniref:ABC-2 transporter permease n=1 Tax=Acholeplasma equifetale TaxID=264634 RepID=UPI000479774D|nr:ABC-2 transporter permease [Acholeplasma equifetale]